MKIKCGGCKKEVTVSEEDYGSPFKCPDCSALLLVPRKKGDVPEAEAKSFEDLKNEIADSIGSSSNGVDQEKLLDDLRTSIKPELEQWVKSESAAASAGIDTDALREQIRKEVLDDVRTEIKTIQAVSGNSEASTTALAKAIESIGDRLGSAPSAAPAPAPALAPPAPTQKKKKRKPFRAEEEDIPDTLQDAYPETEPEEPDVERVIKLSTGDDENLRSFLQELSQVEGLVMFEPTQTAIDVGNWRKKRVWIAVTAEQIILGAYGRRPFHQEIDIEAVDESFWNEFTSEVVFEPNPSEEGGLRSVKLTEDRGYYLLGLIHHGVTS
ncbi:MAG: hypothetical protein QF473_31120 [Planctomycetota bacterium]|jgi:DNA-directed RNA polymerase subunit RPC12/RpoP|nr:hypothetical protein [Planctomycetota bacterium]